MRVAFLGLGRMGTRLAGHVLSADHDLTVWNRTPGRADDLVAAGAREAASVAEAVNGADAVVLMLFGPDSVREVLPQLGGARGALVIDCTTIAPSDAREFAVTAATLGLRYLDAPVAGSLQPATDGTLGVLVGAAEPDFQAARPLLELWGDPAKVRLVGEVGAGSALKLCVNQGIGVLAAGLGESLRLGAELGLDRTVLLDVLGGAMYGWVLGQKRAAVETGDYSGTQFSLDLLIKDLGLAVDAGDGADLAVTRAVLAHAEDAQHAGHGPDDYAALVGHLAGP